MLTTKDLKTQDPSKVSKTLKPGNHLAKIYSLALQPMPSNPEALYLIMNLEGEDQGPEFEGFLYDKDNPNGGRAKGAVGRVKYSQYPYKDMVSKAGYNIPRNNQILRDLATLASALDIRSQIDEIEANTIEEFVAKASKLFASTNKYLNWCIAGNAYMKPDGYKEYSLHLPKYNKDVTTPSFTTGDNVTKFNPDMHITDNTEKEKEPVSSWGDAPTQPKAEGGAWKPTEFEL